MQPHQQMRYWSWNPFHLSVYISSCYLQEILLFLINALIVFLSNGKGGGICWYPDSSIRNLPKVEYLSPSWTTLIFTILQSDYCRVGFLFLWIGVILYEFPGGNLFQEGFSPETIFKMTIKFRNEELEARLARLNAQPASWQQADLVLPGFWIVREDWLRKLQRTALLSESSGVRAAAVPQSHSYPEPAVLCISEYSGVWSSHTLRPSEEITTVLMPMTVSRPLCYILWGMSFLFQQQFEIERIITFYTFWNKGLNRWGTLSKVTPLLNGKVGTWTELSAPNPMLSTTTSIVSTKIVASPL